MATIAERIIEVVNALGGNKSSFARQINVTPAYISKLAKQPDAQPSDLVIKSICREFSVNEIWLRTGEGEMLFPMTLDEELAYFFGTVINEDIKTSVKKQLIDLIAHLPEETWETIAEIAKQRAELYQSECTPPNEEKD